MITKLISQGAEKSKICAPKKPIAEGAEAKIFLVQKPESKKVTPHLQKDLPVTKSLEASKQRQNAKESISSDSKAIIIKQRTPKSYRIPELDDKIRKRRTKAETKILEKLEQIINVPKVFKTSKDESTIQMQFIDGKKLSETLNNLPLLEQKQIAKEIGKTISKLHKENIAHGDLTTSNMILKRKRLIITNSCAKGASGGWVGTTFLIDFGLSFQNAKYEDKAVDLHVLKQALAAKHWQHCETLYKEIEKAYISFNTTESKKVVHQLTKVEKRGRYKH